MGGFGSGQQGGKICTDAMRRLDVRRRWWPWCGGRRQGKTIGTNFAFANIVPYLFNSYLLLAALTPRSPPAAALAAGACPRRVGPARRLRKSEVLKEAASMTTSTPRQGVVIDFKQAIQQRQQQRKPSAWKALEGAVRRFPPPLVRGASGACKKGS
jgi:hypothetical protein